METLSPNGPLDLPLLFMCANRLFGASLTDTRTEQSPEIPLVIGLVPHVPVGRALARAGLTRVTAKPQGTAQSKGRRAPYLGPLVPRHGSAQAGRQKRNTCESAW